MASYFGDFPQRGRARARTGRGYLGAWCLAGALGLWFSLAPAPAAADSCAPPSFKVARQAYGCEYTRLVRAQRSGALPDFGPCERRLQAGMSRAATRYVACPAAFEIQDAVDQCVATVQSLVDPGANFRCRARYYAESRTFSRCAISAHLKHRRTGQPLNLNPCRTRVTRVLDRTQSRIGGCPDVTLVAFEAALLDCLSDLAGTIDDVPPAPTPTATETPEPTDTPGPEPTDTPTPEPTDTPEPEPTDTPTPEPTDTPEPEPTDTPTPEPTDTPEPEPTDTPLPEPTDTPEPTATPEPEPTDTPTPEPTDTPTPEPTPTPTLEPTDTPVPTATPTEVPIVPEDFRRVFISSTTHPGGFAGGVTGADEFCQERAEAAGLPGRFVAWLSTGDSKTQARKRLENAEVPYQLVDGTIVANGFEDLVDGTIAAPINLDEFGVTRNVTNGVWTGTAADGTAAGTFNGSARCNKWVSSSSGNSGRVGTSSATNNNWTNTGNNVNCDQPLRVYCFQSNHRTVFVTSTTHDGDFGGVRGADAFCQAHADAAELDGHFVAWMSTGVEETRARRRIENAPAPYRLVDGTTVALSFDALIDGSIDDPINVDENGDEVDATGNVWTGTAADGTGVNGTDANVRCAQWTSNSSSNGGRVGSSNAINNNWTNTGNNVTCDQQRRVYCVESRFRCGVGSKCAFRTSGRYSANLGGLAGADALCQAAVESSTNVAPGIYKAWLSTEDVSAASRLSHATVPYRLPNGDKIADDWADLTDGTISRTFCDATEFSMRSVQTPCISLTGSMAWTATAPDGSFTGSGSCLGWTSDSASAGSARAGSFFATGPGWTSDSNASCDVEAILGSRSLHCLQQ